MANAWINSGVMKRKAALFLAKEWTKLGNSVRIEHTTQRKLYRVWLRIEGRP